MGLIEDIIKAVLDPILRSLEAQAYNILRQIYFYVQPIVSDVAARVWSYVGPYLTGLSGISSIIQSIPDMIGARIYSIMQPFIFQIYANLASVSSQIYAQLAGFLSHPLASIQQMLASTWAAVSGISGQVFAAISAGVANIQNYIIPKMESFFSIITSISMQIQMWFSSQNAQLATWLGNVGAQMQQGMNNFSRILNENVIPRIDAQGNKMEFLGMTMGLVSQDTKRWGEAIEKFSQPGEGNFFNALVTTSQNIAGMLGGAVGTIMSELYEHVAGPIIRFVVDLFKKFFHSILVELFGGEKALTTTTANSIESIMAVGASVVTGLTAATAVGELAHPLKNLGLGRIANLAFGVIGWNEVAKNITDPISKAKFGVPLMHEANFIFRPRIPSERDLKTQHFEGIITKDEFFREMGMWGYSDMQIDRIYADMFYEPSLREMVLTFDAMIPPESWAKQMMRARGLNEESVEIMWQALQFKAMKDELSGIKSIAQSLYLDGFVDVTELRNILSTMNYPPAWLNVFISMLDTKIEATENKAEMDAWIEAFKKGKATEAETLDALNRLGMRPRIAVAKIQKIQVGMKARGEVVEKRASLTKGEILSAYKEKIIQKSTARERLFAFGYDAGDIDILLTLKAPEEVA